MLECAVNLSEGRDDAALAHLAAVVDGALLDVHSDPDHNRSVFTLAGPDVEVAARALASTAVDGLDLRSHHGVHPRLGVVDVVPFAQLGRAGLGPDLDLSDALAARDRFASWAGQELAMPCFLYGPERSLPEVRRRAMADLAPDFGPPDPAPRSGSCCVGARPLLIAYNLLLSTDDVRLARRVAADLRSDAVRALGLAVRSGAQVSCNLIAPWKVGPAEVFDTVARLAPVAAAELVGLVPQAVLEAVPEGRLDELGLSFAATIESRLSGLGLTV